MESVARKSNVVKFNNDSVMSSVNTFLEIKRRKSENTYKSYLAWYKDFFLQVLDKGIDQLTWDDILSINYKDVYTYRDYLSEIKNNNNKTCNSKIISIRSLWIHFYERDNKKVDPTQVKIEPLLEDDTVQYGALTKKELEQLFNFCLKEKRKRLEKYYFFKLSTLTAFRKDCLINLKWNNIAMHYDNKTEQTIPVIKVKDKGKLLDKAINPAFYEELCSLKKLTTKPEDKILDVSSKTIENTLKRFCKEHKIDENRHICIHSIKKTAMDIVYEASGYNLVETSKFGNHSSVKYAYENYLSKNREYTNEFSYKMFEDNKDNISKLENLSKEELIDLIKESGDFVINKLVDNMK